MKKAQYDVARFHLEVVGHPVAGAPSQIPQKWVELRKKLISEEANELIEAINDQDLIGIADGVADLIYVALGAACEFGISMEPIWDEVQRTNMAKKDGPVSVQGKKMKPEGWEPPRIRDLLQAQIESGKFLVDLLRK